ncbi:MAG: hypothetical protein OEM81_09735 [Acidimicrobiia bacterium]|nr:hypothetical protein [Acidimicrobiia bacterium]MDH5615374.1 hypothetical protein [Acidimicrobiia bacterium]
MPDRQGKGRSGDGRRKPPAGRRGRPGAARSGAGGQRDQARRRDESGTKRHDRHEEHPERRGALHVEGGAENLPKWLRDEITRVTRKDRLIPTFNLLNTAADAFADGRYRFARDKLVEAKALSSRASAIRELLGLSAYRAGLWQEALRELRTFRRLAGDTTHMPVEMDALRAMGKPDEVHKTWHEFQRLGSSPAATKEGRVVYGAFLIDEGDPRAAWAITEPKRITKEPYEEDLRQWYVAARAAVELGDTKTARRLMDAIETEDAAFAGLDQLGSAISAAETS